MDLSGSEHSSRSSGSPGGSLSKIWGTESSLLLGLKDDAISGLADLVHDKDVAAKAVAFVVNGSRKGIVPLCADVGALLRNKLKLERIIEKQRLEIQRLKGSTDTHISSLSGRTSRSTSPTPPSLELLTHAESQKSQLSPQPSSPCSPCSSLHSSSLHLSQSLEISSASCGSVDPALPLPTPQAQPPLATPTTEGGVAPNLLPNQHLVTVEVHRVPSAANLQASLDSSKTNRSAVKTRSVEIQCSLDEEDEHENLEQQYEQVCLARVALEQELQQLREELEQVKLRSKVAEELRVDGKAGMCKVQIENETHPPSATLVKRVRSQSLQGTIERPHQPMTGHHDNNTQGLPAILSPRTSPKTSPRTSDLSLSSRGELSGDVPSRLATDNNHNLTVRLEDHVLIKGERTGYVKYIGHLEKSPSTGTIYVGLQLDAPVGKHDGMVHGKRYFWCHRNHGVFLPVNEILAVINRKPSKRPKTSDPRRRLSAQGTTSGLPPGHQLNGYGGDMKRNRSSQGKRLISADSSNLQTQKNRESHNPPAS